MDVARLGLQASLLVRCPDTGQLYVNFDPELLAQIRETDCMTRMRLEVPPFAVFLQQKQDSLKQNFNKLQVRFTIPLPQACSTEQQHVSLRVLTWP